MKTRILRPGLPVLLVALLVVTACEGNLVDDTGDPAPGQVIVLTEGIPAPAATSQDRLDLSANSNLKDAEVSVGGSSTEPLSINGDYCTDFPAQEVDITYTVTGNQASDASFDVYTTWDFNGDEFIGSDPTTVNVPEANPGSPRTYQVTITVKNSSEAGSGSTTFIVEPFNLNTNTNDRKGHQLSIDSSSHATVHVEFSDCVSPNTPPTLTVPADMTVEATSSAGTAVNFTVTATDAEDDDLTDDVVCEVDDEEVESGDTFGIGASEVECSVTDSHGDSTTDSFFIYVQDTTPPEFTSFPDDQELIASDITGRILDLDSYNIAAEDKGPDGEPGDVSGPVSISCTINDEDADGYLIEIGATETVTCTAEDDASFRAPDNDRPAPNSQTESFEVFVTLDLEDVTGFFRPLRMDEPYSAHKRGSTIPHKFAAPKYADGTLATDLADGLRLTVEHLGPSASNEDGVYEDPATGSTTWRYDEDDEQYVFNAKSGRDWPLGEWTTTVRYKGITLAETNFKLPR